MGTVRDALNQALREEMSANRNVFVIGEEVGRSGGHQGVTRGLLDLFGYNRVLDTPISEIGFTGLAVGASYLGLRPVVEFMSLSFSLQAIDHIINSAAKICYMSGSKLHCPIVFRGPGGYNPGYAAEHVQEFLSTYGAVPGLKVVAPYTAREHKALLKAAIRDENPVVFIESEPLYETEGESGEAEEVMALDKARILRHGKDVTVIGVAQGLRTVERALEWYHANGGASEVELINMISLNEIDYGTILTSARKTGRVVIVDHSWPNYSMAHEVSAVLYGELFGELKRKIVCLTGKATHVGYTKGLEDAFYPSEEEVVEAIRSVER